MRQWRLAFRYHRMCVRKGIAGTMIDNEMCFSCSSGSVASWLWGAGHFQFRSSPFHRTFVDVNSSFVSRSQKHVENVDAEYIVTILHCVCCGAVAAVAAAYRLSAHSMHISFLIVCSRVSPCSTTAVGYKCITQSWTQWKASSSTFVNAPWYLCLPSPNTIIIPPLRSGHWDDDTVPGVGDCLHCCLPFMIIMCNFIRDSILDIRDSGKANRDTNVNKLKMRFIVIAMIPIRFRLTRTEWENISWINKIFDRRHCAGWIKIDSLTSSVIKKNPYSLCEQKRSAQSATIPVVSNSHTMLVLLALVKKYIRCGLRKEKPF